MYNKFFYLILGILCFSVGAQAYPNRDACSGFQVYLEGMYLQPNSDFLQYAAVVPEVFNSPQNFIKVKKVRPTYHLGYRLGLGYRFPCTCNDINLYWRTLNTRDSDFVKAGEDEVIDLPFLINSVPTFGFANGKVKYRYNTLDLEIGHFINFGRCFETHFYAGVRYARIKRNFNTRVETLIPRTDGSPNLIDVTTETKFDGVGPRLGMDSRYFFVPNFGIESDLSVSGVVEHSRTNTSVFVLLSNEDNTTLRFAVSPDNQNRIVPVIDAKLGLLYRYQFCNGTNIKLSAGYQFFTYIGAFNESVIASGTAGINSIDYRKIDAVFDGPYLALNVKI